MSPVAEEPQGTPPPQARRGAESQELKPSSQEWVQGIFKWAEFVSFLQLSLAAHDFPLCYDSGGLCPNDVKARVDS